MGKKQLEKSINIVASNLITDIMYSFATDLLKDLEEDENIVDVDRAMITFTKVTTKMGIDGLNLRKASIIGRNKLRKQTKLPNM